MEKPEKNLFAYILPFLVIAAIMGVGFLAIKGQNIDFSRLYQIVKTPEVSSKITMVYQKGTITTLPWGGTDWQTLGTTGTVSTGDTIHVSDDGKMVLRFFDESEIRLEKGSSLEITRVDKDDTKGNHIAVNLTEGSLWARIPKSTVEDSDFIVTTKSQVVQASQTVVFSITASPESTTVIGGSLKVSLAEKVGTQRKPLGVHTLNGGEQLVFDNVAKEKIANEQSNIVDAISPDFMSGEWYRWNDEIEQNLGYLVDPKVITTAAPEADLDVLEEGLVTVTQPESGATVGSSVLVKGTYDIERIEKVYANGTEAVKSVDGEWEAAVALSGTKNVLLITAKEKEGVEKQVSKLTLKVLDKGPEKLAVTFPHIDENGNAVHEPDDLEMLGEVSTSATRVCVSHNNDTPYCLKGYKAGDSTWRYVAAVKYSNFMDGQNKYTVTTYDSFSNSSTVTVYIFHNVPKPDKKVEPDPVLVKEQKPVETQLSKPVVTEPTTNGVFESTVPNVKIRGTVSPSTASIFVNDTKIRYESGSETFEFDQSLEEGENLIKLVSVDANGQKSKTTLYRVTYTNKAVPSTTTPTNL